MGLRDKQKWRSEKVNRDEEKNEWKRKRKLTSKNERKNGIKKKINFELILKDKKTESRRNKKEISKKKKARMKKTK